MSLELITVSGQALGDFDVVHSHAPRNFSAGLALNEVVYTVDPIKIHRNWLALSLNKHLVHHFIFS